MKKICYVSGTRADFGLMRSVLSAINADEQFDLSVCATAMHCDPQYGNTIEEVVASGYRVCAEIPVHLDPADDTAMPIAIGQELVAMTRLFADERPDIVLLLGDRGETLAAALAAVHLNIHVAHVHGGERSGTVDEMIRHCISRLSHFHFTATEEGRQRLIKMGEVAEHVYVTGAPGLDDIHQIEPMTRADCLQSMNFPASAKVALVVYHPVVQEKSVLQQQMHDVVRASIDAGYHLLCLTPNADTGGNEIDAALAVFEGNDAVRIVKHLPRPHYLAWINHAAVMIGNSSSGIIEAASFHCPVVNIGNRQNLRERNVNTIDVDANYDDILDGIAKAKALPQTVLQQPNVYGDGDAAHKITGLLKTLTLSPSVLNKNNAY